MQKKRYRMSWIIDGEDDGSYTLDLLFGGDKTLNGSGDPNFIDIAILERGGNSEFTTLEIKQASELKEGRT